MLCLCVVNHGSVGSDVLVLPCLPRTHLLVLCTVLRCVLCAGVGV